HNKLHSPLCKTLGGLTMGTSWSIKLCDSSSDEKRISLDTLDAIIQATLERITKQMSPWEPDSTISHLNRAERGWYQHPDELYHVLSNALALAQQTQRAYYPTLGALVDLCGFGPSGPRTTRPTDDDIAAAIRQAG